MLQRTPVGRWLHGKEHSINISSINKCVQTHHFKNTNLLLFTETFINTKGSEIYSLYYCSHISQEKQSVFVENSPSFKYVNFQTHTRTPKERTHIINYTLHSRIEPLPREQTETSHPVLTTSLHATEVTVDAKKKKNVCKCVCVYKWGRTKIQMCKLDLGCDWYLLRFLKEWHHSRTKTCTWKLAKVLSG